MGVKISGFDELEKKLKNIAEKAENISGRIPFDILFNADFMKKYTKFTSMSEMLEKSEFEVKNAEDFSKIPEDEWDKYVKENTSFENWDAMKVQAGKLYVKKELGF